MVDNAIQVAVVVAVHAQVLVTGIVPAPPPYATETDVGPTAAVQVFAFCETGNARPPMVSAADLANPVEFGATL